MPGVSILGGKDDAEDNCWLTAIIVDPELSAWTSGDLGSALARSGIETRPLWKPMHLQPVNAGFGGTLAGKADRMFAQGVTLPSGSAMSDEDFAFVMDSIHEAVA